MYLYYMILLRNYYHCEKVELNHVYFLPVENLCFFIVGSLFNKVRKPRTVALAILCWYLELPKLDSCDKQLCAWN